MLTNFIDEIRFFLPSVQLTKSLAGAIETAHSSDLARVMKDERQVEQDEDDLPDDFGVEASGFDDASSELESETFFQQRQIASELFGYLAFQAESPQAQAGNGIPIHDSIIAGMSVSLGLSQQSILLSQLASEFCLWLKEHGEFMAGWGRVIYADSDRMYLEGFPDNEFDESTEQYASALSS